MVNGISAGIGPMALREAIEGWADEREKLRYVQTYTAKNRKPSCSTLGSAARPSTR